MQSFYIFVGYKIARFEENGKRWHFSMVASRLQCFLIFFRIGMGGLCVVVATFIHRNTSWPCVCAFHVVFVSNLCVLPMTLDILSVDSSQLSPVLRQMPPNTHCGGGCLPWLFFLLENWDSAILTVVPGPPNLIWFASNSVAHTSRNSCWSRLLPFFRIWLLMMQWLLSHDCILHLYIAKMQKNTTALLCREQQQLTPANSFCWIRYNY